MHADMCAISERCVSIGIVSSAIAMLREDAMQCWVERLGAEIYAVGRQTTGHEHWDLED